MLVCADFANIEGRVQAWLAGEEWKLQAFRDFDAGVGPDTYNLTYSSAFNIPIQAVTKDLRQVGKAMELGLGFEGGISALVTMARTYRVSLETLPDITLPTASDEERDRAEWAGDRFMERQGRDKKTPDEEKISYEAALACDVLKQRWRVKNSRIVSYWAGVEGAALNCVRTGEPYQIGRLFFGMRGRFLHLRLPSGRLLAMCDPEVVPGDFKDWQLTFWGMDSVKHKWMKKRTYGGDLFQSAVQATARDLLASAMQRTEAAGYPPVMTVHDEIVSELPAHGTQEEFDRIMVEADAWAAGLPIAVAGWVGHRYRKD